MNKAFFLSAALFFSRWLLPAQNLVPNPDFEAYTTCPTGSSQFANVIGWTVPANHLGTPDYLNTCIPATSSYSAHVPDNFMGYQWPASGNGYVGLYMLDCPHPGQPCSWYEYIQTRLTTPLYRNIEYRIAYKYSLADKSSSAPTILGIHLSDTAPVAPSGSSAALGIAPTLFLSTMASDTANWQTFNGLYWATGGEEYLTFGSLQGNLMFVPVPSETDYPSSYLYLDDFVVERTRDIVLWASQNNGTVCAGDEVRIDAINTLTYRWVTADNPNVVISTDSNITVHPSVTTTYILYGDLDTVSYTVTVLPGPTVDLGPDQTLCEGNPLLLDATHPVATTYRWQNGSSQPTLSSALSGKYWVEVSNAGCTASDTVNLTFVPYPTLNLGPDVVLCQGQSIVLDVGQPGAVYRWQDQSAGSSYAITGTGTYWVEAAIGPCRNSDTLHVLVNPSPTVNLGPDSVLCQGQSIVLNATGNGLTYRWQDGSAEPDLTVTQTGIYSVTVDLDGCTDSDSVRVTFITAPYFDFGPDSLLCSGKQLTLDIHTPMAVYLWQDKSQLSTFTIYDEGTYWGMAGNQCGTYADTIKIGYRRCDCYLYIPDAISLNGDGVNENFPVIPKTDCGLDEYNLAVFNRWGRLIFETGDEKFRWNGHVNQQPASADIYVYRVAYKFENSPPLLRWGHIYLLR